MLEIDCSGMPNKMKSDLMNCYEHQDIFHVLERLDTEIPAYKCRYRMIQYFDLDGVLICDTICDERGNIRHIEQDSSIEGENIE